MRKYLRIYFCYRIFAIEKETKTTKNRAATYKRHKIMTQTFIVKAHTDVIRVAKQFILDSYHPYLYASDDDFSVIQFKTKKEMKEAFANIAKPCGETFYIDSKNGATYIKVDAQGRKTANEFLFLASMITPYSQK